jgi:hypothetical protein
MIDHAVADKIQEIIDELHAVGAENRLSLGWLLETLRDRLLHHPSPDVQAFVREQLRKKLN